MNHVDVAIIGSGPAGLTAGIYTSRALLKTVLIGGREYGGQLMQTTDVENFPGFPEGIQGPELMARMSDQATRFGVTIIKENVTSLESSSRPFRIKTDTQELTTDAVILAMGANHSKLEVPNEDRLSGHGVSYCATCDGFFFRGKEISVVGGGDSAMEEATFLTKFASKVYIVHRRNEFRASKIMVEKAKSNPKIEFILNVQVKEIIGEKTVSALRLVNSTTGEERDLALQGVFVAIGNTPNTNFLAGQIELDPRGYIVNQGEFKTSIEGVFVAGDVHDHKYRQAITAAGFGCAAALETERFLAHERQLKESL